MAAASRAVAAVARNAAAAALAACDLRSAAREWRIASRKSCSRSRRALTTGACRPSERRLPRWGNSSARQGSESRLLRSARKVEKRRSTVQLAPSPPCTSSWYAVCEIASSLAVRCTVPVMVAALMAAMPGGAVTALVLGWSAR